jgi:hypothetical protein
VLRRPQVAVFETHSASSPLRARACTYLLRKGGAAVGRATPQRSLPPCGGGTGRGACTRRRGCGWAEQCHNVPSPHRPSQTGVNALMPGEGQGGGADTHRARSCFSRSDSENQESRSGICPASDWKQPGCLLHPPPCPSPAWGEGTLWHRPSYLSHCIRVYVPTCVQAQRLRGNDTGAPSLSAAAKEKPRPCGRGH